LPLCCMLRRRHLKQGRAGEAWMCRVIPLCLLPGFVGAPVSFWWTENRLIALGCATLSLFCLGEVLRRAGLPHRRERVLARVAVGFLYAASLWGILTILFRAGFLER